MKKIPLQVKLLLNILVFAAPIIVLTILMYRSESVNIDFALKEKLGTRLQRPYEDVLHEVDLARRGMNNDLETKIAALKVIYNDVGPDLLFDSENLQKRKRENASFGNLTEQVSKKNWDEVTNSINTAITHLGDISNLILDPDLDSYYLMDITLLALPQMQNRIQTILQNSDAFFAGGKLPSAAQIQAALYAAQLEESDLNRVIADAQTAINEDPNFYGTSPTLQKNIPATVSALTEKTKKVIDHLRALSRGEEIDKTSYYADTTAALNQSFTTWKNSVEELDVLLANRTESLQAGRKQSLIYSSLALLFAILLSVIIGLSIHQSINAILASVLKLKESAETSGAISAHLKEITANVKNRIHNQARGVEQTAAAIEEMNSMINLSAENSKEASQMADKATSSADSGQKQIMAVLNSMSDINEGSKKIVQTVSVIDDIAFQTNLLALNASVEAARAGEQGKGFAVVADAVRALAQKSATSAREINELLKSNVDLVSSSQQRADEAASTLNDIVASIKNVSTLSNEVAKATEEQAIGLAQVAKTMSNFEKETNDNQQNMNEVAEASNNILDQSTILNSIIVSLETEVRGQSN